MQEMQRATRGDGLRAALSLVPNYVGAICTEVDATPIGFAVAPLFAEFVEPR